MPSAAINALKAPPILGEGLGRGFSATEFYNYSSSRIGMVTQPEALTQLTNDTLRHTQTLGYKVYEFSNHLGNVLTTFSDRKIAVENISDQGHLAWYTSEILSSTDYYPFGFQMPGRVYEADGYRYGFNGKEQDPETYGTGNVYDYGFRIYNPRIGRFLSVDPLFKEYPWYTSYQFAGNKPISAIDLDGLEELIVVRFFDQDKYTGHCAIRIPYPYMRDENRRRGGDMQIIELDYSQQAAFIDAIESVTYSDPAEYEKLWVYLRNPVVQDDGTIDYSQGTFKGEYRSTMAEGYRAFNKGLIKAQGWAKELYGKLASLVQLTQKEPTYTIQYPYDKSIPISVSNETIENLKTSLITNPDLKINIFGYTSSENNTGDVDYNKTLSQERADFMKKYLIDNGIDANRILNCEGRGDVNPVASNDTQAGKEQNRRVEIEVTYQKTQ
ncbi:MAG TPA: OmpA family protein [Bacteroidales bacterium]|nr:OmpA family protein [Bacteroidales bacterium]